MDRTIRPRSLNASRIDGTGAKWKIISNGVFPPRPITCFQSAPEIQDWRCASISMKSSTLLIALLLAFASVRPSSAMTRIADDRGGSLGEYLIRFATIRDSGEHVMIDGGCFSACTLVTAFIPKERICVTKRAVLGFHAGWIGGENGQRAVSVDGTRLLYEMYPRNIRAWITRHGGLSTRTIILTGEELAAFYQVCK